MNKGPGDKQVPLRNGWFNCESIQVDQAMNFQEDNQSIQKRIQKVLEEQNLWSAGGLNLECPKSKCSNC